MKDFKTFLGEVRAGPGESPDDLPGNQSPKIKKKLYDLLKSKKREHKLYFNVETEEIVGPMTLPKLIKQRPEVFKQDGWRRIIKKRTGSYYSEEKEK